MRFFGSKHKRDTQNSGKVFGIGLSRTGTTSLTHALTILEYRTIHLPSDDVTQREITEYFERGDDALELTILRGNDALTDYVVCCIYQGLDRAYPGSKFVLTVRDKESWLDSYERLMTQFGLALFRGSPESSEVKYLNYIGRKLGEQTIGDALALAPPVEEPDKPFYDRKLLGEFFDTYHAGVYEYFKNRPDQLLTLNIIEGEGWEKLAPFLGHAIPEQSFPFEMKLRDQEELEVGDHPGEHDDEMAQSRIEAVQAYLNSFQNRDVKSCTAFFSDQALLKFMDKRYEGRRGIEKWHQERFKTGASVLSVGEFNAQNNVVKVDLTVASTVLKRLRVKFGGKAVMRFADGKIHEMWFESTRFLQ
jgi:hypothetical protein